MTTVFNPAEPQRIDHFFSTPARQVLNRWRGLTALGDSLVFWLRECHRTVFSVSEGTAEMAKPTKSSAQRIDSFLAMISGRSRPLAGRVDGRTTLGCRQW